MTLRHTLVLLAALLLCGAAGAVETDILFDGTGVTDWSTARDPDRLSREFSLSEVTQATDPPALRWRFIPRDAVFNDLFLTRPTLHDFSLARVHIRSDGEPFELAAKVRDANGAEWTVPAVRVEPGDWRWVEFPRDQWRVGGWSSDVDGKLSFPLASFTLIAYGVKPQLVYDVRVSQIEMQRPDRPVATLQGLQLPPGRLRAGQSYPLTVTVTLDRPTADPDVRLSFMRGKSELFRLPLIASPLPTDAKPAQRLTIRQTLTLPLYALGGDYQLLLRVGEAHIRKPGATTDWEGQKVQITQRETEKTIATVKPHNGVPTLFINGQPQNGMAWATYGPTSEVFSDFTKAGVNLFTFSATPTEAGYNLSTTTWTAPDTYDYSQLDARVMMLLQANPRAYFFPRLYLHAPKWWSEQHPDDIVLMDPGDGNYVPFIHSGGKPAPSWASETWRRDTVEGLRRLIAHVEASPYSDRVVGYHIASGTTEEWMMWGGNEGQWVDYSPVNVARFRDWLRARYGTDARLQAAWNDPAVTLATAAIPTRKQREHTELGSLRDAAKEQQIIDFYLYNSDLVAETIEYFAAAVKKFTKREKIAGFFYGYLLQLCGEQRQQNAGHLALDKVLACPDVDFVTSPTSYAFRGFGGEGTSHFMSLLGSVQLHGKLWFDENDIRTSLSGGKVGEWGRPPDVDGDIIQQDKELANVITNGTAQWWFDVGSNKYNDPRLLKRISELREGATKALAVDRTPVDEVAMVVDESSLTYLKVADRLGSSLLVAQLPALQRIGAPVGHYLTDDLPRLTRHKLFLVMTSFAPSAEQRKAIDALKRDGHILVFCYVPGLYRDGKLDEAAMTEFTGINLRLSREPQALRVTLKPGNALTEGLETYGVDQSTFPVAFADDPLAEILGTLPGGQPGLVVKKYANWTAVHTAAPMLPTALLRRLAQQAGVHLYIDTPDTMWASRDLISVCAKDPGTRTIRLPARKDVTDLYTGAEVAKGATNFDADFPAKATRVFRLR